MPGFKNVQERTWFNRYRETAVFVTVIKIFLLIAVRLIRHFFLTIKLDCQPKIPSIVLRPEMWYFGNQSKKRTLSFPRSNTSTSWENGLKKTAWVLHGKFGQKFDQSERRSRHFRSDINPHKKTIPTLDSRDDDRVKSRTRRESFDAK